MLSVPHDVQLEFKSLIKEFADVFPDELPKTLPPNRGIDDVHKIDLIPNASPVAKAPYKTSPQEQ